MKIMLFWADDV